MKDEPRANFADMAAQEQRRDERMQRLGLLDLALNEAMELTVGWIPEEGYPLKGTIMGYLEKNAS